jgi:hypothetical protein
MPTTITCHFPITVRITGTPSPRRSSAAGFPEIVPADAYDPSRAAP